MFITDHTVYVRTGFAVEYPESGWRQARFQWTTNPKCQNGLWQIEWWRDWCHHVNLKGQGRGSKMFGANYLENASGDTDSVALSDYKNGTWRITWSHDRWRHVTLKGQGLKVVLRCKYFKNGQKFQYIVFNPYFITNFARYKTGNPKRLKIEPKLLLTIAAKMCDLEWPLREIQGHWFLKCRKNGKIQLSNDCDVM